MDTVISLRSLPIKRCNIGNYLLPKTNSAGIKIRLNSTRHESKAGAFTDHVHKTVSDIYVQIAKREKKNYIENTYFSQEPENKYSFPTDAQTSRPAHSRHTQADEHKQRKHESCKAPPFYYRNI